MQDQKQHVIHIIDALKADELENNNLNHLGGFVFVHWLKLNELRKVQIMAGISRQFTRSLPRQLFL